MKQYWYYVNAIIGFTLMVVGLYYVGQRWGAYAVGLLLLVYIGTDIGKRFAPAKEQ